MIGHKIVGQGPRKVIVLNGWFSDCTAFDPLVPFLDTETFTYAFMDYRGYGQSALMKGEYSMPEIAQDVLDLAQHLGWEKFHLIGHSMGGMAVQWLAAHHGDKVESMVGITPVAACGFTMDADGEALFRGAKTDAEKRHTILMMTTGNRLSHKFGDVLTERSFQQTTPDAFDGYLTAWAKTDFVDKVKGNTTRFLVLVGEFDQAVTEDHIRKTVMQWFPNATMEALPNAGHYPMIETPLALMTRWEDFLKTEERVLSPV